MLNSKRWTRKRRLKCFAIERRTRMTVEQLAERVGALESRVAVLEQNQAKPPQQEI